MPHPPLRPAPALLALAALPAFAQVKVLVSAPVAFLCSGSSLQFQAAVQGAGHPGVAWSVAPDAPISAGGLFTAPDVQGWTPYTVRATSLADGKAYDEQAILVLPGDAAMRTLHGELGGFQGPALKGLPFLDWEQGAAERFQPGAAVAGTGETPAAGPQVVGYGLPAPLAWDAKHAGADGVLVSYREGPDWIRVSGTGRSSCQVRATGPIRDCKVEALRAVEGKAQAWTSHVQHLDVRVRGMLPWAGNAVTLDDDPETGRPGVFGPLPAALRAGHDRRSRRGHPGLRGRR